MVRTGCGSGPDMCKQEMLYVNIAAYIINNVNNVPVGQIWLEMEMEMGMDIYVNTDMHVYVYVCVRNNSRDLEAGGMFLIEFSFLVR